MILVDIYIPSLGETYDFRVDETARVVSVVQEISEMLTIRYKSKLNKSPEEFMLCSIDNGQILYNDSTLWENNIKNGGRLLMV